MVARLQIIRVSLLGVKVRITIQNQYSEDLQIFIVRKWGAGRNFAMRGQET